MERLCVAPLLSVESQSRLCGIARNGVATGPDFGRHRANMARSKANLAKCGPTPVEVASNSAEFGPPFLPSSAQMRSKPSGRIQSSIDVIRSTHAVDTSAQLQSFPGPFSGRVPFVGLAPPLVWPISVNNWRTSGRSWPGLDRHWIRNSRLACSTSHMLSTERAPRERLPTKAWPVGKTWQKRPKMIPEGPKTALRKTWACFGPFCTIPSHVCEGRTDMNFAIDQKGKLRRKQTVLRE